MIGQILGHYRIESKLGEGGMGVVYKARDTHLDRLAAVKVLTAETAADPERKIRFVQEAKTASALNHPNIVHIYDIDTADGLDFIAMEYVAGNALTQLIRRKGMELRQVLRYAIQIADALAKAHAAGIEHRDLKPANVMITDEGLVKVLDFGLAKLTERLAEDNDLASTQTIGEQERPRTSEGMILGTVAYMSPEQAEGKSVDVRSDIFSFGSLVYEMVTRAACFPGRDEDVHADSDPQQGAAARGRAGRSSPAGTGEDHQPLPAKRSAATYPRHA
jgi:eukaryotic-like serine/threonine-protein kinase